MLSNTHIIDRFLDKNEIEIDDIFSDVCEVQHITPQTLPQVEPKVELDIGLKSILNRTMSMTHRYSIDGSTLKFVPPSRHTISASTSTNYQLVTKVIYNGKMVLFGSTHLYNIIILAQICFNRSKSTKPSMSPFCSTPLSKLSISNPSLYLQRQTLFRPQVLK